MAHEEGPVSPARRLLDLVDAADTRGVSAAEAFDALGGTKEALADLLSRMVAADRAWLGDDGRLYSTAPF